MGITEQEGIKNLLTAQRLTTSSAMLSANATITIPPSLVYSYMKSITQFTVCCWNAICYSPTYSRPITAFYHPLLSDETKPCPLNIKEEAVYSHTKFLLIVTKHIHHKNNTLCDEHIM